MAFALTIGAVFVKRARATPRSPQGSTLSDTTGGFSLPAHSLHRLTSPPSFPSVRNLYFISELWSSSAQLSADKAQEALERRHGYLDGEGEGAGERKAGRQAGTQPPRGTSPSPRYFFPSFFFFFFFSPALTASPPPPPPYLSGRVQLVPAAASTRSPAQPRSWSLYQNTPTTRKAESN